MFILTNQQLTTSFYIKSTLFAKLAMRQRWSAVFCATGVWGGKPIGRVRVKILMRISLDMSEPVNIEHIICEQFVKINLFGYIPKFKHRFRTQQIRN